MKAKELMIGDWVYYHDKPIQIIDGIYQGKAYTKDMDIAEIKLNPIPLTPGILKKNGFKMCKYDGWVHYYEINGYGGLPFIIHSMIGGEMLSREVDSYSTSENGNRGIDMDYVHELQHALRLCGLKELADNFKL